jgi:SAM-dependent methyltransferase
MSLIDFLNPLLKPVGVNIGGGKWQKFRWVNIDNFHGRAESSTIQLGKPLPFKDQSLSFAFSSHFFEHASDDLAVFLFTEIKRILKPSGILRISVPDSTLAMAKYKAGDHLFFDRGSWGFEPRYPNWKAHGVEINLENKLSFALCGYENKSDEGRWPAWNFDPQYYCGPVRAEGNKIAEFASKSDISNLHDFLMGLIPKDAHSLGHINWWTFEKFEKMLGLAGFKKISRSTFRGSKESALSGSKFDNRPDISLYVEAES